MDPNNDTDCYNNQLFLPDAIFEQITEVRVHDPGLIEQAAKARKKRRKLTKDGKLTILAADHPGRGVTAVGNDPFKMGNRQEYLGRVLRVLVASDFDGFMGTSDFIEDLLILDYLVQEHRGPSFLDEKVLVGCMQRGGVAGVAGEIDDRFGAYTAESLKRFRLDGGKMMFRFVPDDERTLNTIDYCSRAVTALNHHDLIPFVEPLRMDDDNGRWVSKNTADELTRLVGVVSALGDSSRNIWMKLPYCENFHQVAMATTMPILLLGGESKEDPRPIFQTIASGLGIQTNVRGALVGRNVTFPGSEDPAAVAQAIWHIVHSGWNVDEAVASLPDFRNRSIDFLVRYLS